MSLISLELSPIGWHDFLAAVPLLEEFKLSAQTFNLSELLVFATMLPHLRLLEFDGIECIGTEEVPPTIGWHPANQSVTIRILSPPLAKRNIRRRKMEW
ncbi:hypothetical protein FRC09_006585 [Ceratobasidium sp. 395]|nr:hypothetical protein FRC09_006585 [Ceratobasidium sp. 395]